MVKREIAIKGKRVSENRSLPQRHRPKAWLLGLLLCLAAAPWAGASAQRGSVPDLVLTVTDSADPVAVGAQFEYILNLSNQGSGPATGVRIDAFTSGGLTYVPQSTPGWTCIQSTVIQCTLDAGSLNFGASAPQLRLLFQAPGSPQTVQLTASALANETDQNPGNNTNIQENTNIVVGSADLNLSITPSTASAVTGTPISFTANINNLGPSGASNLQLTGTLGGQAQFSSFTISAAWSCSHNSGSISCQYQAGAPAGTLGSGLSAAPVIINAVAGPGAGSATINLLASSSVNDPTPANANASIVVTEPPPPQVDMSLQKQVIGSQPIPRGTVFTFRLLARNEAASNQSASGIQINDPLPAGIVLQSFSGANWSCIGNVVCTYGLSLTPGQTAPALDLQVIYDQPVPVSGVVVNNTASVSAAEPDPVSTNNVANASAQIRGSADVGVQLNGPASVQINSSFNVDLVASNAGPDDAANVSTSVTIATGFAVGAVSGGAGWSCTAVGQTVTCLRAALPPGASNAASVTLTAPPTASAGLTNTANISTTSFDGNSANNSANQLIAVIAGVASLALTKTDSVDPVLRGALVEYVLTVRNTGTLDQSGFTLVDTLPAALSYDSFVGNGWICTGANVGGATVTCNNPSTLVPGNSSVVRIRARANQLGLVTNQAQVVSTQLPSPPTTASETTTIVDTTNLTLSKTARTPSVVLGSNALFDIQVSNTSASAANGLVLIDTLPQGLAPVSASGQGWNCSISGQIIDCRRPQLGPQSSSTVLVESRPLNAGNLLNRVELSFQESSAPLVASDSVLVTVPQAVADIAVSKTASSGSISPGDAFEYRLQVANLGPDVATGVRVLDELPPTVELLSTAGAGWTCTGNPQLVCQLSGPLSVGTQSTVVLQVRATANASNSIVNRASVSANEPDSVPANNTDTVTTAVVPRLVSADLGIDASAPSSAAPGEDVTIRALLSNRGPDAANQPLLRLTLTGPGRILSAAGGGFVCGINGPVVECRRDALASNAEAEVLLQAQLAPEATSGLSAAIVVSSATPDPNPSNNSAQLAIALNLPPPRGADLSLGKLASAAEIRASQEFSYQLVVRNAGPASAEGVVIRDELPASLTLVAASGPGLVCSGTRLVECRLSAPLPAGQEVTATLRVNAGETTGTVLNQASVVATTEDPQPANNLAEVSVRVRAPDAEEREEVLDNAVRGDALAGEAVRPVVDLCSGASGNVAAFCSALNRDAEQGRSDAVNQALRSVYPEEVMAQFSALNQLAATQFFNVDARMSELRGGGGGFSVSGLTMQRGSQSLPLGLFQGLLQDDEPQIGGPGDLISPWGFFVNGTISRGDQDIRSSDREVMLDFDSVGITAGVDYRKSSRWVFGAALGYNSFESGLTDLGSLKNRGFTLTGYNAYYLNERVYWDTRVSYGSIKLDQVRRLRVNLTGFSLDERLASSTDARQLGLATSIGYHWTNGAWTITPNAFLRYTRGDVDGFTESGSDFAVAFGDQSMSATVFGAGVQVSRVFSLSNGVFVPQFDLVWNRESGNDGDEIRARFVTSDSGEGFVLRPEKPDQSYGSVGLGFVYVMANGRQAYLQWRESVGMDGLSRSTLNLGARFEF